MLEMKKIRSKKLFGELVSELRPYMNDEGLEVLDYFGDPENINAFKLGELKEDLVKSIVPANFTNVEDFLDVAQNIGIKVEGLDTETVEKIEKVENDKINGKVFVVTGSVNHYKNRNELKADIEKNGGKVTGSVTSKTNYLINNDIDSNSSKNKKNFL